LNYWILLIYNIVVNMDNIVVNMDNIVVNMNNIVANMDNIYVVLTTVIPCAIEIGTTSTVFLYGIDLDS